MPTARLYQASTSLLPYPFSAAEESGLLICPCITGEVLFIGPPGIAVPPAGTCLTLLGSAADLARSALEGSSAPQLTKRQRQKLRKEQQKAANTAGTGVGEGTPALEVGKKKKKKVWQRIGTESVVCYTSCVPELDMNVT